MTPKVAVLRGLCPAPFGTLGQVSFVYDPAQPEAELSWQSLVIIHRRGCCVSIASF